MILDSIGVTGRKVQGSGELVRSWGVANSSTSSPQSLQAIPRRIRRNVGVLDPNLRMLRA